jgi:hypothetical protein
MVYGWTMLYVPYHFHLLCLSCLIVEAYGHPTVFLSLVIAMTELSQRYVSLCGAPVFRNNGTIHHYDPEKDT